MIHIHAVKSRYIGCRQPIAAALFLKTRLQLDQRNFIHVSCSHRYSSAKLLKQIAKVCCKSGVNAT
jgi:hypothetical protein